MCETSLEDSWVFPTLSDPQEPHLPGDHPWHAHHFHRLQVAFAPCTCLLANQNWKRGWWPIANQLIVFETKNGINRDWAVSGDVSSNVSWISSTATLMIKLSEWNSSSIWWFQNQKNLRKSIAFLKMTSMMDGTTCRNSDSLTPLQVVVWNCCPTMIHTFWAHSWLLHSWKMAVCMLNQHSFFFVKNADFGSPNECWKKAWVAASCSMSFVQAALCPFNFFHWNGPTVESCWHSRNVAVRCSFSILHKIQRSKQQTRTRFDHGWWRESFQVKQNLSFDASFDKMLWKKMVSTQHTTCLKPNNFSSSVLWLFAWQAQFYVLQHACHQIWQWEMAVMLAAVCCNHKSDFVLMHQWMLVCCSADIHWECFVAMLPSSLVTGWSVSVLCYS